MPSRLPRPLTRALLAGAFVLLHPPHPAMAASPGQSVFDANCSMCHQLGAAGVPGQFPRLAGRAHRIASTAAGRRYLEHVILYGMIGPITVDHTPIEGGFMPSFASLSNRDLAAALSYVISLDRSGKARWKAPVIRPAQIARVRAGKAWAPAQVHRLRARVLGKAKR
jgi:mono/diheme cytochrome c family protein